MRTAELAFSDRRFRLLDGVAACWRAAPLQTLLMVLNLALSAALPSVQIAVTASFVNTGIAIVQQGLPVGVIAAPLAGLAAVLVYELMNGTLMKYVQARLLVRLRGPVRAGMLQKRARLEYGHIENERDWDLIGRVAKEPEARFLGLLEHLFVVIRLAVSAAGVMAILVAQVWWAGLIVLAVSAPLMALSFRAGQHTYDADRETTKIRRGYDYLYRIGTDRESAAERTLFSYNRALEPEYGEEYERARRIVFRVERKMFIRMKAGGIAVAMISVVTALALAQPVVAGAISVGMFISLVQGILQMAQSMSWDLSSQMEGLAKDREYCRDLTEFSFLSEQPGGDALPAAESAAFERLEFCHVGFTYPGNETPTLCDLSFTMERGKHYSFVGVNGAGKTTITKLICGLYDGYTGEILLNGRELRGYAQPQLKAMFCGVFQDFARYNLTVRENIALGNARTLQDAPDGGAEVADAARLAGLEPAVRQLERGYDAELGKLHEGGVDFSGGEWQRVAMARAVYSPAPFKILDEPTAALDPIAESEVYRRFEALSAGSTTLFISHRLGSTLLADEIFVLDGGTVAEKGSHRELMERGGIYAEMFESQRSWYR